MMMNDDNGNDGIDITCDCVTIRQEDSEVRYQNAEQQKRPRGRPRKDGKPAGSVPKKEHRKMSKEELSEFRRAIGKIGMERRLEKYGKITGPGRPPSHVEGRMPTQCMTVREIDHDMIAKWAQVHNCTISAMVRKIVEYYYTHEGVENGTK